MQKVCINEWCRASYEVTDTDLAFYAEISPVIGDKRYDIPAPPHCPDCRSQRRGVFRNERILHKRTCDLCRQSIISIYHTGVSFPVYCPGCFFSSNWDPLSFGQSYREGIPFFDQLKELYKRAPRLSVMNRNCENTEYGNYVFANKNCYLISGSHYNEDCLYGVASTRNRDCIDFMRILDCELCYQCITCANCHRCISLRQCTDCNDCLFSRDLSGCKNCIFSANLRHKEYHIFNKPVSKEKYEQFVKDLQLHTHDGYTNAEKTFTEKVQKEFPARALHHIQCEDCDGDDLRQCSGLRWCFSTEESEDCAYGFQLTSAFNCMDCDYVGYDRTERCYMSLGCTGLFHSMFCNACWHGNDLYYSQYCHSSKNCTGCVGLHQAEYRILNKQYEKDDYDKVRGAIFDNLKASGEWGSSFPPSLTTFGYNETVAQEWFPRTKENAISQGFDWHTDSEDIGQVMKILPADSLPQSIDDIPDDILNWGLKCPITGRLFRLTKQELEFYRTMRLPVPRIYPEERHRMRLRLRAPRKLWSRTCSKCSQDIRTTFAPDRPEIVYCEDCYLKEVY